MFIDSLTLMAIIIKVIAFGLEAILGLIGALIISSGSFLNDTYAVNQGWNLVYVAVGLFLASIVAEVLTKGRFP